VQVKKGTLYRKIVFFPRIRSFVQNTKNNEKEDTCIFVKLSMHYRKECRVWKYHGTYSCFELNATWTKPSSMERKGIATTPFDEMSVAHVGVNYLKEILRRGEPEIYSLCLNKGCFTCFGTFLHSLVGQWRD